ncbi:hypothetical protein ACU4GD_35995 [Cupriavidus basilensis]
MIDEAGAARSTVILPKSKQKTTIGKGEIEDIECSRACRPRPAARASSQDDRGKLRRRWSAT